jgi:hypothetical protein
VPLEENTSPDTDAGLDGMLDSWLLATAAVFEEFVRAGRYITRPALACAKPNRWPGPVRNRAEMAAYVVKNCWQFFLRQLLDQAEQLLALSAHRLILRRLTLSIPVNEPPAVWSS